MAVLPAAVTSGAMTAAATMPLVAVSVLAWVMIALPIVLVVGVGVAYLLGRRQGPEEVERAQQAAESDAPGPSGPTGRLPGA
jgi:membrane protein DedA with SNARE-associated domain